MVSSSSPSSRMLVKEVGITPFVVASDINKLEFDKFIQFTALKDDSISFFIFLGIFWLILKVEKLFLEALVADL